MGLLRWLGLIPDCERDPVALTDANFADEVRRSDVPVLVDIWSPGCQPCLRMVPTIRKLACKYAGEVKVAQLNAAAAPKTAAKLGVRSTPTLLFFKNGAVVERVVGAQSQYYLEEVILDRLLDAPSDGAQVSA